MRPTSAKSERSPNQIGDEFEQGWFGIGKNLTASANIELVSTKFRLGSTNVWLGSAKSALGSTEFEGGFGQSRDVCPQNGGGLPIHR